MKRHLWPLLFAVLSSVAGPGAPARAQVREPSLPKASGKPEKNDNRPPIPPGVPTTPDNVYLPTEGEVRLGRESAAEAEKEFKVITSGPYYDRVQRVAREVLKAVLRPEVAAEYRRVYHLPRKGDRALRVPFEFSFKVIDDPKMVNAFSLAGGPVYVSRGLLDFTPSDHELAAVLAHECSHVVFHHVEQEVKKQRRASTKQMWTLLAAVIAGMAGGRSLAAAAGTGMMGAQLVTLATLTGYSRELEAEADRVGVLALRSTQYNPVGMYTFMKKLASEDKLRGNPDFGIYQSHPYPNERVAALKKQLAEAGCRLDVGTQRQVSGAFRITTHPGEANGKPAVEVRLDGNLLFVVASSGDEQSRAERAERMARQLRELLHDNFTYNDVRRTPDKTAVLLKGVPVIRVYPEDAAAAGSAAAATERAMNEISRALLKEQLQLSR